MAQIHIPILREGQPENFKNTFEISLMNYVNNGYKIIYALLDSNDKLVLILQGEIK